MSNMAMITELRDYCINRDMVATNVVVFSVFQRMIPGDKHQTTVGFTKATVYLMSFKCAEIIVVEPSADA